MSKIEIYDLHTAVSGPCLEDPKKLTSEKFSEIFSKCRHGIRLLSMDGRNEAGKYPVSSVMQMKKVIDCLEGKMLGFVTVNPYFLEEGLEAMELGVKKLNMKAIGEMVQYMENWVTDEYMVLPVVKKAGDLDVPINFHAGGEDHVEGVVHLAESFPKTKFIMAHFGGRAWRFAAKLLKNFKIRNVWVELNIPDPKDPRCPIPSTIEMVRAAVDCVDIDHIVFGTDFNISPGLDYQFGNRLLDVLETMKMKDRDMEKICSLNAKKILKVR